MWTSDSSTFPSRPTQGTIALEVGKRPPERTAYKQSIPAIGLSLERYTNSVPNDGSYYVLHGGQVKGRFRTKSAALDLYRSIVRESGFSPPPVEAETQRDEALERYLDQKAAYWADSHKHVRRGGKGRF